MCLYNYVPDIACQPSDGYTCEVTRFHTMLLWIHENPFCLPTDDIKALFEKLKINGCQKQETAIVNSVFMNVQANMAAGAL